MPPAHLGLTPSFAGLVHIFAPSQQDYQAAEARILGLAGESVKVRTGSGGIHLLRLLGVGWAGTLFGYHSVAAHC